MPEKAKFTTEEVACYPDGASSSSRETVPPGRDEREKLLEELPEDL